MPQTRIASLLSDVVRALPDVVPTAGLYAAGSLGTSDFQPGRSDLDLIAIVQEPLAAADQETLRRMHRSLAKQHPDAEKLHCLYVAAFDVDDRLAQWPYWAHMEWGERRFSALARAELHDHGVVIAGQPIASLVPYVTHEELIEDVRAELTGVWLPATDHARRWWSDDWVDLGLTVLPRARAAISDGSLLSKTQAISRLGDFGVPPWLRENLLARRRGWVAHLGPKARADRAKLTRELVRRGVLQLLEQSAPRL